jgi:four helix bundle protein
MHMAFVALEVALEVIAGLSGVVKQIEGPDRALGDQVKRAASSVALNLAEGAERRGRDRAHSFRIASGSAAEVRAALRVAAAWGYLSADALEPLDAQLDRLAGLLWGLTHS